MAMFELDGVAPTIGEDVFLAPTAVLVGDVRVGDRANIWFGTVLRGDVSYIEIGAECSIQDNAVIHCADELPTMIGADVIVGHGALLEGCMIERPGTDRDGRDRPAARPGRRGRDARGRHGGDRTRPRSRRGCCGGRPSAGRRRSCPARRWPLDRQTAARRLPAVARALPENELALDRTTTSASPENERRQRARDADRR